MINLILKFFLFEQCLLMLFTNINKNISHQSSIKVGDLVRITYTDYDTSNCIFTKAHVIEVSSKHMIVNTPSIQWILNLTSNEQKELSLIWKTMSNEKCRLLHTHGDIEIWELQHSQPWYIDYNYISNLIVEKL